MDGTEFVTMDWVVFIGGVVSILAAFFVAGRGGGSNGQDGPFGLYLWDARTFSSFLFFAGLGTLGMWLAVNMDEGNLVDILGENAPDYANFVGLLTGLAYTAAVLSAGMFAPDAPLPKWVGAAVSAIGFTILFASGLTITVSSFYNAEFTGGTWAEWMPLFPMNEFVASVWTAVLLALSAAAVNGIIAGMKEVSPGN
tara:strand:+ start:4225 stop:4815 length:591 start_codon:yes stop_codon:yes gene_type:complete